MSGEWAEGEDLRAGDWVVVEPLVALRISYLDFGRRRGCAGCGRGWEGGRGVRTGVAAVEWSIE